MDPELLRLMEATCREIGGLIGRVVQAQTGGKQGFALFIFSFEGPEMTWISNSDRGGMIAALEEFIRRYRTEAPTTSEGRN